MKIHGLLSKCHSHARRIASAQKFYPKKVPTPVVNQPENPSSLNTKKITRVPVQKSLPPYVKKATPAEENNDRFEFSAWYTPPEGTKAYELWEKKIKQTATRIIEQNERIRKGLPLED